jgi:hypothetical protein
MRASGLSGELRYGYQIAARLGAWEIAEKQGTFRLRGRVASVDPVWITRRPIALVVALGPVEWKWSGVDPVIGNGVVEIALVGRPDAVGDARMARERQAS